MGYGSDAQNQQKADKKKKKSIKLIKHSFV